MELFLKYPNEVQEEVLQKLVQTAKATEFGKQHGFGSIKNYENFVQQVPLCQYESIAPLIERSLEGEQNIFWPSPIKWFAKSSGTTNAQSKFIPISPESLEDCHFKGGKDMLSLYFNNNPDSELFMGKGLRLGGSKKLYENNNSVFGDLSAILIDNLPFWVEMVSTPSNEVSLMEGWEQKMQAIVAQTTSQQVTSLAGVPSWMLVLLHKVLESTGKNNILEVWPNLEVYFHGGVNFEPYRSQYHQLLPKSDFRYYEIYNASEGFFGLQDKNESEGMLLMLDYGIFYEFIPLETLNRPNQKTLRLSEVVLGQQYAMVITTNAGLWRYQIGDTVRFTTLNPYRVVVSGRTKSFINVFGEELMVENADRALTQTSEKHGVSVLEYTAGPVFMEGGQKGKHEWIVEFENPPADLNTFSKDLDLALQALNSDYQAKRAYNMTLEPLFLHRAKRDLFYNWMAQKNKLGGQHKVPRLSNDRQFLEELLSQNT